MILGPVSLVDCIVFVAFLVPQLVLQAGLFTAVGITLSALPFIFYTLPLGIIHGHLHPRRAAIKVCHVARRRPSFFQDIVLRCVRYAFKHLPSHVARVFFAKEVTMPFLRFRLLRHGYWRAPVEWRDVVMGEGMSRFRGVWIARDRTQNPDLVLYYIHGGGFALGSTHFYLEFLLAWHGLLRSSGYRNPAIFSLEYTLVPDAMYPKQVHEAIAAYEHVLNVAGDPSRVCVGADSAGATVALSMLLELGTRRESVSGHTPGARPALPSPALAVLISPWPTLMLDLHKNTETDYLDKLTLWKHAHQYAGALNLHTSPACPGACRDDQQWRWASPRRGFYVRYGGEEVLAGDIRDFVMRMRDRDVAIEDVEVPGQPHAWTVASLFLGHSIEERLEGLNSVVGHISRCMPRAVAG